MLDHNVKVKSWPNSQIIFKEIIKDTIKALAVRGKRLICNLNCEMKEPTIYSIPVSLIAK